MPAAGSYFAGAPAYAFALRYFSIASSSSAATNQTDRDLRVCDSSIAADQLELVGQGVVLEVGQISVSSTNVGIESLS